MPGAEPKVGEPKLSSEPLKYINMPDLFGWCDWAYDCLDVAMQDGVTDQHGAVAFTEHGATYVRIRAFTQWVGKSTGQDVSERLVAFLLGVSPPRSLRMVVNGTRCRCSAVHGRERRKNELRDLAASRGGES